VDLLMGVLAFHRVAARRELSTGHVLLLNRLSTRPLEGSGEEGEKGGRKEEQARPKVGDRRVRRGILVSEESFISGIGSSRK